MLTRKYICQKGIYWDNVFAEFKTSTITRLITWSTVFKELFSLSVVLSRSVFQHNFENYNEQIRMESLRNFTSRRANKALENQVFSTAEKLNETDTAVASSSKQQNKKLKKGKNRPF